MTQYQTPRVIMEKITHAIIMAVIEHGPIPSYVIARRIGSDPRQVTRILSKLVKQERVTRGRAEGKTYSHYTTTEQQRNAHLNATTSQNLTAPLEDIPQRLRFLNGLWQKTQHGHPVLSAIIKDYERTLREFRRHEK